MQIIEFRKKCTRKTFVKIACDGIFMSNADPEPTQMMKRKWPKLRLKVENILAPPELNFSVSIICAQQYLQT